MKKHFFILSLAAATSVLTACNEQYETTNLVQQEAATFVDNYRAPAFAEPDGSKPLTSFKAAENLKMLFNSTGPKIITSMGCLERCIHLAIHEVGNVTFRISCIC